MANAWRSVLSLFPRACAKRKQTATWALLDTERFRGIHVKAVKRRTLLSRSFARQVRPRQCLDTEAHVQHDLRMARCLTSRFVQ